MKRFDNKTVMITGAGGGIGYAVMQAFASEGANIIACEYQEQDIFKEKWDSVAKEHHCFVYPFFFDLANDEAIKDAMKHIYALKTPIDVLVNNAGVSAGGFLAMTSIQSIKDVFQINYFAQVLITQYISKLMCRAKSGTIVNTGSVMGIDSAAGGSAYGASKAAFIHFTKCLSKELAMYGVRVNAVAPNLINTQMAKQMEQKSFDSMINTASLKRMGEPSEVANTILFLASDESSYINGQVIRVDGGM
ncbi:MAG: SDR family oxidoreductase [Bacteroidales bacterium]|nr:SDR family oxidoreductase [Bacteroidales bacterium]